MHGILKLSDAATLALHTMAFLAGRTNGLISAREIASSLEVSEAHLAKVLQRLARAGMVKSSRGPKGGFALARPADETSLLEVYEAIEGPLTATTCLLGRETCLGSGCILGGLIAQVNKEVSDQLTQTRLSQFTDTFSGGNDE